jgi:hypothetical protein
MTSVFDLPESHPLRAAHKKSFRNRGELAASQKCGCFDCKAIFDPRHIAEWVDRGGPQTQETALCPFCGNDTIIGDSFGFEITGEFLEKMHEAWCDWRGD